MNEYTDTQQLTEPTMMCVRTLAREVEIKRNYSHEMPSSLENSMSWPSPKTSSASHALVS